MVLGWGRNKGVLANNQLTIGLVGNPNCGKTTVFNGLTGARQKVGNWPGVTVERKSGFFQWQGMAVEVVDLPGTYSLTSVSETAAVDERIACEFILQRRADVIVNVLDASNLERNLYLTAQLIEMRVPVIVAVNMMDVARQRGLLVKVAELARELGFPVVALEAHKGKGIRDLKEAVTQAALGLSERRIAYPWLVEAAIEEIGKEVAAGSYAKWLAIRLLEDDVYARSLAPESLLPRVAEFQKQIRAELNEDADILLADARYRLVHTIATACVEKTKPTRTLTTHIDNIVLNRFFAIPIFLAVMYCMFLFAINIGGAFQDFFDISSNTLFVGGLTQGLTYLHAPDWLIALLAEGVGKGVSTTLTFIPVIGAMFLALAFLEDSGYMARASFVIDRLMRALGLPGKSFVPMIVGFGCNVPAVMGARTLENKRDRILTVMMSPFMSCGARLAIYAVFVAAFFPIGGQNIVFALYLIGIGMAMLTGLLLRKTLLKGDPAPLVMELPPYHVPHVKTLLIHAWQRLKGFVLRAGKLIVPICVLIGMLNALHVNGVLTTGEGDTQTLLSMLGQSLTPIFAPMGIHQDNWPATVGLLTGVLAKEVVVGTLNALYSQLGHFALQAETFNFWGGLQEAFRSIPTNLSQLAGSLGNPIVAQAPVHTLSQDVYGLMFQRFDGRVGAMAYLLFVLLYFPCVSTTAAMARELSRGWAAFSVLWTTGVAYGAAVGFYQLATFLRHPVASLLWIVGIVSVFALIIIAMRMAADSNIKWLGGRYELAGN